MQLEDCKSCLAEFKSDCCNNEFDFVRLNSIAVVLLCGNVQIGRIEWNAG